MLPGVRARGEPENSGATNLRNARGWAARVVCVVAGPGRAAVDLAFRRTGSVSDRRQDKSEIRNAKQIQNPKTKIRSRKHSRFGFPFWVILICFGFRISIFGFLFPPVADAPGSPKRKTAGQTANGLTGCGRRTPGKGFPGYHGV